VLDHTDHEVFRSRPRNDADDQATLTFVPDGVGGVSAVRAYGISFSRVRSASGQ
jgi:hypothetical protein